MENNKEAIDSNKLTIESILQRLIAIRQVMDERDRLYTERDRTRKDEIDAQIRALKEQTALSFASSEKAIQKAENAQNDYNTRSNEFRGQLDDQAKRLMPRQEVDAMVRNLDDKILRVDLDIRSLRDTRSELSGKSGGTQQLWGYMFGFITIVVAIATAVISFFVRHIS